MSKKWGYNYPSSILAIGRFTRKKIFEFQTKYFRLKSHNSEYFGSSGRGEFIIHSIFAISRVASHPFHTPPPPHRRHPAFCDDKPSKHAQPSINTPTHYALIFKTLTIYRHKTKNPNPKKKSTV
jgi:hypothetical protein